MSICSPLKTAISSLRIDVDAKKDELKALLDKVGSTWYSPTDRASALGEIADNRIHTISARTSLREESTLNSLPIANGNNGERSKAASHSGLDSPEHCGVDTKVQSPLTIDLDDLLHETIERVMTPDFGKSMDFGWDRNVASHDSDSRGAMLQSDLQREVYWRHEENTMKSTDININEGDKDRKESKNLRIKSEARTDIDADGADPSKKVKKDKPCPSPVAPNKIVGGKRPHFVQQKRVRFIDDTHKASAQSLLPEESKNKPVPRSSTLNDPVCSSEATKLPVDVSSTSSRHSLTIARNEGKQTMQHGQSISPQPPRLKPQVRSSPKRRIVAGSVDRSDGTRQDCVRKVSETQEGETERAEASTALLGAEERRAIYDLRRRLAKSRSVQEDPVVPSLAPPGPTPPAVLSPASPSSAAKATCREGEEKEVTLTQQPKKETGQIAKRLSYLSKISSQLSTLRLDISDEWRRLQYIRTLEAKAANDNNDTKYTGSSAVS